MNNTDEQLKAIAALVAILRGFKAEDRRRLLTCVEALMPPDAPPRVGRPDGGMASR